MILCIEGTRHHISDYGIEIPAAPDKVGRIMKFLRSHPSLTGREEDWFIQSDGSFISREDLIRVHSESYVEQLFSDGLERALADAYELIDKNGKYHRYDPTAASRPLTEMFEGTLARVAGTYQACKEALAGGFCFYCGGGAHHAHRDFGHGFCVVNDSVIALRKLQAEGRITRAWVIDVDAHKGDGTAALTAEDPSIVTLSAHMAEGWPLDKPKLDRNGRPHPSFTPSDIDIPVGVGEDDLYLGMLKQGLDKLVTFAKPDLALVLLGADAYEKDGLPSTSKLKLSLAQMFDRDMLIYSILKRLDMPQAYLMAGGYGEHAWEPYPPFLEAVISGRFLTIQ